jgi:hypothetical protein
MQMQFKTALIFQSPALLSRNNSRKMAADDELRKRRKLRKSPINPQYLAVFILQFFNS